MTEITQVMRPWAPDGLEGRDPGGLSYVVVDEIEGGSVGLAVSEWPRMDAKGRVRFGGDPVLLGADRRSLQGFLAEHRQPRELAERPLRVGDVFALRAQPERLREAQQVEERMEPMLAPADWIGPPVLDVTPDARDAAKASFYAAVTPSLDPAQVARIDEIVERPPPPPASPAPPPAPPPPRGWFRSHLLQIALTAAVFAGGLGAGVAVGGGGGGSAAATEIVTSTVFTTLTNVTGATATEFTTETSFTTETVLTTETVFTTETLFTTETVFEPAPPPPPPRVG